MIARPASSVFWGILAKYGVEAMLGTIEHVAATMGADATPLTLLLQRRFADHAWHLRLAFAQGNIKLAVITALKLGALEQEVHDFDMIREWLVGVRVREGGVKGAKRRSQETHHDQLRRTYKEVRPQYMTNRAAYRAVAKMRGVMPRKVRRAVTGH